MKLKALSLVWLAVTVCGLLLIGFSYQEQSRAIEGIESLKEKQEKIKLAIERTMPATVAVTDQIGSGSGVIVSEDGLVLTASHVLDTGGEKYEVIFSDGRRVTATPLGQAKGVDAGMMKIDQEGPWPFVPLADLQKVQPGDWCMALGYPGGYQLGRTPPVRVGRVLANARTVIMSDCAIIGGDSGGPLFNLEGEVIGIHSSIGESVDKNRHIPITMFQENWDRLVAGEVWGRLGSQVELNPNRPMLGIQMEQAEDHTLISGVIEGSPAEVAGLQTGDRLVTVDGDEISRPFDVIAAVGRKQAGDTVKIVVLRQGESMSFKVKLTRKSELELPPSEESP